MAELSKKLHFLKNGTEQTAKAYSTAAEAGSIYIPSKIDGVACYIPIGSTSDVMATNGRVIKGGTTYAIKSQSKPAYAEKSWTTPGTYTWTAPTGVTRVRVAVCGGGGGGFCQYYPDGEHHYASGGGTSKFGNLIQATGGGGAHGTCYEMDIRETYAGSAGSPNGRAGATYRGWDHDNTGGTGFVLSFTLTKGSYGTGGGINTKGSAYEAIEGGTGGSGGYNTGYVNVSAGSSYTIVVGGGGAHYNNGGKASAKDGNSGFVLIAYGGDI